MIASRLEFIRLLGEINASGGIYHYGDVADSSHVLNQAGTECQIGERVGNLIDSEGNVWLPLSTCEAYLVLDEVYQRPAVHKISRAGWYRDVGAVSIYSRVGTIYDAVYATACVLSNAVNPQQPLVGCEQANGGAGNGLFARSNWADNGFDGNDSRLYNGTSRSAQLVGSTSHRLGTPESRVSVALSISGEIGATTTQFFGASTYSRNETGIGAAMPSNRDRLTLFCSDVDVATGTADFGEEVTFFHFGFGNGVTTDQAQSIGAVISDQYPTTSVAAVGDSRFVSLIANGTFRQLSTIGSTVDFRATSGAGLVDATDPNGTLVLGIEGLHVDTLIADDLKYDYMVIYAGVNRAGGAISNADNLDSLLRIVRKVTENKTADRILIYNDTPSGQFGGTEDDVSLEQQEWSRIIGDYFAGIDNVEIVDSWGNSAQGRSSLWQENLSNDGVHPTLPLDSLGRSSLAHTRSIGEAMRIINDPTRKLRSTFVRPETHWQTEDGVDKAFKDGDKVRHDLDVAASAATDVVVNTVTKVV